MSKVPPPVLSEFWLPIEAIGAECPRENSTGKHPPLNRLHVWWARRPLVVSRAAMLAGVLPQWHKDWPSDLLKKFPSEVAYQEWFLKFIGIHGDPVAGRKLVTWAKEKNLKLKLSPYGYPRAFTVSPTEDQLETMGELLELAWGTRELSVLDPFSGGGSIPFEALRFGFKTYANELNPVASVILKATLDFPARFGVEFADEIKKWGKKWTEHIEKRLRSYFPKQPGESIFCYLWARTVTCFARFTSSRKPGMLKQPSSPTCTPSCDRISGLISTSLSSGLSPAEQSMTVSRCERPTCGAAKPTPLASYMVSNMSLINSRNSGVSKSVTRAASDSRTGSPYLTIGRIIGSKRVDGQRRGIETQPAGRAPKLIVASLRGAVEATGGGGSRGPRPRRKRLETA